MLVRLQPVHMRSFHISIPEFILNKSIQKTTVNQQINQQFNPANTVLYTSIICQSWLVLLLIILWFVSSKHKGSVILSNITFVNAHYLVLDPICRQYTGLN